MSNLRRGGGRAVLCWTAACLFAPPTLAQGGKQTIADLAPRNSILVAGTDDCAAMFKAFDRTGLRSLWDEPEMKAWVDRQMKEGLKQFDDRLTALGLDRDDLERPVGAAGVALWLAPAGGGGPGTGSLAMADYAENADRVHKTIQEALERAERSGAIAGLDERDEDGTTIWTVTLPEPKAPGADEPVDVEDEMDFGDGEDDASLLEPLLEGWRSKKEIHYAKVGGVLLLCDDRPALVQAIDRAKGQGRDSVESAEEYRSAVAQIGPAHVHAVLLAKPLTDALLGLLPEEADPVDGPSSKELRAILEPLGVTEIRAVTASVRFDTEDAGMEQTLNILAPRKTGLLALFDTPAARAEAPAFAAADASALTVFQMDLAGILPLVNRVIAALPQEAREEMGPMIGMMAQTLAPLLGAVGPEITTVSTYQRPFSAESEQTLLAVRARDAQALAQALGQLAPMFGLESREFQGNQIWSSGGGGLPIEPPALGMGFGQCFIGPQPVVENAMRQAGEAGTPRLSADPKFKAAIGSIKAPVLGFQYSNTQAWAEYMDWYLRNFDKVMAAQIDELFAGAEDEEGMDAEDRRDMADRMKESAPSWVKDPPPLTLMSKHIGDTVWELRSTDSGYVMRSLMLRTGAKN